MCPSILVWWCSIEILSICYSDNGAASHIHLLTHLLLDLQMSA